MCENPTEQDPKAKVAPRLVDYTVVAQAMELRMAPKKSHWWSETMVGFRVLLKKLRSFRVFFALKVKLGLLYISSSFIHIHRFLKESLLLLLFSVVISRSIVLNCGLEELFLFRCASIVSWEWMMQDRQRPGYVNKSYLEDQLAY